MSLAASEQGKPYVWSAEDPEHGFDCSGLVYWAAKQLGVTVPRVTYDQFRELQAVNRNQLQPGDLIYSHWGRNGPESHVVIYAGGDQVVEASSAAGQVRTRTIDDAYWSHVDGIRRISALGGPASSVSKTGVPNYTGSSGSSGGSSGSSGPSWWEFLPPVALYEWVTGSGSVGQATRSGLDGISDGMHALGASAVQVGNLANLVTKLWLPTNILRGVLFLWGTAFILIGIWFLASEVKNS